MKEWKPEVGKYALAVNTDNECMLISEHCGDFWCKFENGALQTWSTDELLEPINKIDSMVADLINVNPCISEGIAEIIIKAGYRKPELFDREVKICNADLYVDGYEVMLKKSYATEHDAPLELYDSIYRSLSSITLK